MHGLLYNGRVTSPTFTLSNIYILPDGREVHHYDLYRLGEAGIVGQELQESLEDNQVITIIEWAGIANHILPSDRLTIEITVAGESQRNMVFTAGGPNSKGWLQALKRSTL